MPPSSGQITLYPANRLEDLAILLEHVLRLNPGGVLTPSSVIVQSQGMQHWVSMALAASRGLCMNVDFPMPGVFIWQLVRRLLGPERVPQQSPYAREALAWRIDRLLAGEPCRRDSRFAEVNRYWGAGSDGAAADPLKRFQLASKQADLFEQYLLFRPDWIEAWQRGETPEGLGDNWQAALWRLLVAENPDHPLRLQQEAAAALGAHRDKLPAQVCLFAVNSLPPGTLQFFDQLARYTQVHLFHLNPCVAYWGDLQSEKQQAAQRAEQARRWLSLAEPASPLVDEGLPGETGNPLLANLGGQGREFFAALQGLDTLEISAFELPAPEAERGAAPTLLQQLQRDILTLHDARPSDPGQAVSPRVDASITVSASHSALRELQALHDWLLHRFNEDASLTPRDVLVMCPQVEQYAPYVSAVFDSGFFPRGPGGGEQAPRLPVSISDRAPRDAEPLISSFLELLTLPDSRFQVSRILDLLRLPSLQARFGFSPDELTTLEWWLGEAGIHWGLDGEHKARLIGSAESSEMFSWSWGLRRLLLGFARSDQAELVDGDWLLPHVEGSDALLLGRLMQLLERLQLHARQLARPRPPAEWGAYLRQLQGDFFLAANDSEERDASEALNGAIDQLLSWSTLVDYSAPLTLDVVRFYLHHHLGMPDASSRFMTGQITFCSLEPMRSAPFRVIAILGLNDGEFPRQQVPYGFDLMAQTPRRAGDRSRRGDDRYLFLEALLCTRDKLYLSYQGADIRNNSERQPSLILTELMDYLARGYGWRFESGAELRRQPLHPFNAANYRGDEPSFDRRWHALSQPREARDNRIQLPPPESVVDADGLEALPLEALVRFFDNPARAFGEERLGLRLAADAARLDDAEPFDADGLDAYQGRARLLDACLAEAPPVALETARAILRAEGRLPDSLRAEQFIASWSDEAAALADGVRAAGGPALTQVVAELALAGVRLSARLPLIELEGEVRLLLWRPARVRAKDQWRLWLYHLLAQATGQAGRALAIGLTSAGKDKPPAAERVTLLPLAQEQALEHLTRLIQLWREARCQPLLLNAQLGMAVCASQYGNRKAGYPLLAEEERARKRQRAWEAEWAEGPFASALVTGNDPYVNWFWPAGDRLDRWWPQLDVLYGPAVAAMLAALREEASQ